MQTKGKKQSVFVGAWMAPQQKKRLQAAAMLRGVSMNRFIVEMIDSLRMDAPAVRVIGEMNSNTGATDRQAENAGAAV